MISRRKIATHMADQIAAGRPVGPLVEQLAAYLLEYRLTGQAELMVRDIQSALARDHGIVLTEVVSARQLSDRILASIEQYIAIAENAKQVQISTSVDPGLLGGLKITTPRAQMDTTVRNQLNELRA